MEIVKRVSTARNVIGICKVFFGARISLTKQKELFIVPC